MKTEVQLTSIDELVNTDHIGFVHNGNPDEKGYITKINFNKYAAVSAYAEDEREMVDTYVNCIQDSLIDALDVPSNLKNIYRFDTRKELYQWLAE